MFTCIYMNDVFEELALFMANVWPPKAFWLFIFVLHGIYIMSNSETPVPPTTKIDEAVQLLQQLISQHSTTETVSCGKNLNSKDQEPGPSRTNYQGSSISGPNPPFHSSTPTPVSACQLALKRLRDIRKKEHHDNFTPYSDRKGKAPKKRSQKEIEASGDIFHLTKKRDESWIHRFVALASTNQKKVPTNAAKHALAAAGLGEKVVRFQSMDLSYKDVVETIVHVFPKLNDAGGFELMRCPPNARDLFTITLSSTAGGQSDLEQLQNSVGQGRVYIRPIQCDLPMDNESDLMV